MKFLALGSALEKAGFTQSATKPSEPPPFFSATARKQSVVGGKISRDPIDKLAALLISKAPWWAKPPIIHETPEPADTGTQTPTEKRVRHPSHRFKGKRPPLPAPTQADTLSQKTEQPQQPTPSQTQPTEKPFLTPQEAFWRLTSRQP